LSASARMFDWSIKKFVHFRLGVESTAEHWPDLITISHMPSYFDSSRQVGGEQPY
jgi:hypothetical protein